MDGLSAIVPHSFRDHVKCRTPWCGYKKDPNGYKHGDLPGGKDVKGEDLRANLEEALRPFMSEESAKKLVAHHSVIDSKAPKVRHYLGSESRDFRTTAGIGQFNKGHTYTSHLP